MIVGNAYRTATEQQSQILAALLWHLGIREVRLSREFLEDEIPSLYTIKSYHDLDSDAVFFSVHRANGRARPSDTRSRDKPRHTSDAEETYTEAFCAALDADLRRLAARSGVSVLTTAANEALRHLYQDSRDATG